VPESSPQERPSGTDASDQQPTTIESSQSAPAPTDTSTSTSADPPKKQPPQVPVLSRTSSRADKQSTLEKSQETTNHESDGPLHPRRSILNRRRDKSRGSSKRSRRQNQDVVNMENSKAATNPDTHRPPPSEKKSKRSSKLFAFLTCCASSSTDTEDTVPPKKTVRQPGPNTQPTPEKIDVHTGDSSTVEPKESKHIEDEKPNLTVTPHHRRSQEEERNLNPPEHDSQVDGTAAPATGKNEPGHDDSQKEDRAEAHDLGGPQDIPDAIAAPEKEDDAAQKTEPADTLAAAQVTEGPTDQPDHPTEEPPSAGDSDKDDTKCAADEEGAVKSSTTDLPPPPPAPPAKQEPNAPAERPPMLLPPALPHLQGRKCLVLDLDETLVHSSFKVFFAHFATLKTIGLTVDCRFWSARISPFLSKSRANTTIST
jgi:RNA polymerase II subunit A small phosphatase-like protein